jgi:hypothetical protein
MTYLYAFIAMDWTGDARFCVSTGLAPLRYRVKKGGLLGKRKSLSGILPIRDNHPAAGVICLIMIGAAASQLLINNMEHAKSPMKWADIKEIAEATYSLRYFL